MKKLLTILSAMTVIGTVSTSVIACGGGETLSTDKVNISNKIPDEIDLGKLNDNNKESFLNTLQSKLIIYPDLEAIIPSDYDIYKSGTTDDIQDSDIINNSSLSIKIVASDKHFIGTKDNIIVTYTKNYLQQQDTIYIDKDGKQVTTSERNLSAIDSKEIVQIGFYEKDNKQIQVVTMPKTIEKVPDQLPTKITDISYMFYGGSSFNQDISKWKVDNVTNMNSTFAGASSFNQDISKWKVDNVTNMSSMFAGASSFNQDLSSWKVDNVTNMSSTFANASSFNQDLSSWKVDNVTDMNSMFSYALSFNQDISKWNVNKVTNMNSMFRYASSFNQNLSSWKVNNVTNMSSMFADASSFNQDISSWKVDNVTNMNSMFSYALSFNQDISKWKVDNVTDMNSMFADASSFNQDISKWKVDNVTDMSYMFADASSFNQDLSSWKVDNVTQHKNFVKNLVMTFDKLPKFRN